MMGSVLGVTLGLALAGATVPQAEDVQRWGEGVFSSASYDSHLAIDPDTPEVLFVRSTPDLEDWKILVVNCTPEGWSDPRPWALAADGFDADPWFTADGRYLYFISTRGHPGGTASTEADIWRAERRADSGWSPPERLPEPVNSSAKEWFPRSGPDGWLYFGSGRPGGAGKTDIWRARTDPAGNWVVENVQGLNTNAHEYEAAPSPDGRWIVVAATGGLAIAPAEDGGWGTPQLLGARVNGEGLEVGMTFSPSGHSLMFSRVVGTESGELFLWRLDAGTAEWPPACAATSPDARAPSAPTPS